MVDHLIKTKAHPKTFLQRIIKTTEINWPRLHSIHQKVNQKIEKTKPPQPWTPIQTNT